MMPIRRTSNGLSSMSSTLMEGCSASACGPDTASATVVCICVPLYSAGSLATLNQNSSILFTIFTS